MLDLVFYALDYISEKKGNSDLFVSFCIAAYNSGSTLESVVRSISISLPYEVVITDNNSDDNTLEVLSMLETEFQNVRHIRKRTNRGEGRNLAIENAKGNIIVILDADVDYSGIEKAIFEFLRLERHNEKVVTIRPVDQGAGNSPIIVANRSTFEKIGGYPSLLGSEDKYLYETAKALDAYEVIEGDFNFLPLMVKGMTSGAERRYTRSTWQMIIRRLIINRDMVFVYEPTFNAFKNNLKLDGNKGTLIALIEYFLARIMSHFVKEETIKERVQRLRNQGKVF